MDKEDATIFSEILISHEEKGDCVICDNRDRPWWHWPKWDKLDGERQIPYDLWYVEHFINKLEKVEEILLPGFR